MTRELCSLEPLDPEAFHAFAHTRNGGADVAAGVAADLGIEFQRVPLSSNDPFRRVPISDLPDPRPEARRRRRDTAFDGAKAL